MAIDQVWIDIALKKLISIAVTWTIAIAKTQTHEVKEFGGDALTENKPVAISKNLINLPFNKLFRFWTLSYKRLRRRE